MAIGPSLRKLLEEKNGQLTKGERKIVEYLFSTEEPFLTYTVMEFAEKADVSEATVVRFCKHIGCKGYQDFKIAAAREMMPKEKLYNPIIQEGDEPSAVCEKVFGSEMAALEETLQKLDAGKLEMIARMIRHANRVVFIGSGGSLWVGQDALHKFMKIGIMVYVYEDMDLQSMAVSLLGPEDLVFAVSHSGSNVKVNKCAQNAKENGVRVVALTGDSRNPLEKTADITVKVSSEATMFRSESASTRIAQLAVIDAIVALAAFLDYDRSFKAIQSTRQATSDNKF